MSWFLTFLEGILSFLSPCTLPLLPVYLSYFAGGSNNRTKAVLNACLFIVGFSAVFIALGALSGVAGSFFSGRSVWLNILCGALLFFFGLCILDVIRLPVFTLPLRMPATAGISALLFGIVFSLAMTPCAGAYLGSALTIAASAGSTARGIALLAVYSLGLGLPYFFSALLSDRVRSLLEVAARHRRLLHLLCGGFLMLAGVLTALGLQEKLVRILQ